ncbi:hypothetical protein Tsac_2850 [Thermoanaerobacterium phage THSA-485A]|uniref:hypothetical protein n=1 Tax=Thermoanaerobacterium phage THSA-485A TaxID=1126885 RepID=UPI000263F83B|nr:hypothetical protein Tsac_2850 [Thermoanaerobacterium phage THSA-485A]AFK87703.1 hypothetical protein Tsac_2850 [Thermoanaerobacterium phage THSA-485A]
MKNVIITFDLKELDEDFEGYTVTMKNPKYLPFGEASKFANEDGMTALKNALAALIISWNLDDENGNILPLPKDDPTSLDKVPAIIVNYLGAKIAPGFTQALQKMRNSLQE